MENKAYQCLYPLCNSIPEIQVNDGFIEFICEKSHKKIIPFEKIDYVFDDLIVMNKDELDMCKTHNKKHSLYCKDHKQNICEDCNAEEAHKNCVLKFNFKDLELIDKKLINNEIIPFVQKKDTYFSELLKQIINSYENYKNNYILYLNAHRIMTIFSILKNYYEEGIVIKFKETNLFVKDFSRYNDLNELKYEISDKFKNRYKLQNLRYNFIFFFFKNDKINKCINYPEDYEEIKNEKEGELKMLCTDEYNKIKDKKVDLDFSTKTILKEAVDYGEQTKIEINFDKKNNKEKLVEEEKLLEKNYLYQNIDTIGYAPNEEEEYTVLSLLSKVIKEKGTETAVYKESPPSLNDSVIQMMCCNLSKKYDFVFDFGDEENKKILENKDECNNLSNILKKKLSEQLNIKEEDIVLSIPKKGSVKFSAAFSTPGNYKAEELEVKLKDVKELKALKKIHQSVLMEGCKLSKNLFDHRWNNRDGGWGKGEKRGGFDYIPPEGWIGYGLNVGGRYDGGNNDWLSYEHPKNEYAIAYYPIKNYYDDPKEMKKLIASLCNNNTMTDNQDLYYNIFANDINKRDGNSDICGDGIYLFQDIKIAEMQASIIEIKSIAYKVLIMCRVNPNKIRIPKSFPNVWILNPNSFEIRQYRVLLKIVPLTRIESGTLIAFPQPRNVYREIVIKKDLSAFNDLRIQDIMGSNKYNKHEAIINFYTSDYYYDNINTYLYKNNENNDKFFDSYIWCLHSTLRNYYKDVNSKKILPVKDGTKVYRKCPSYDFKKYGVGSQFYFSSFTSTSMNENIKTKFKKGSALLRIIIKNNEKSNYCYLIENISDYKTEEEVLITSYCNFIITNISKDEKGLDIIDMDCLGYVPDDDNPKKWPKENENIIKHYTTPDLDEKETKGKKIEKESGCSLI